MPNVDRAGGGAGPGVGIVGIGGKISASTANSTRARRGWKNAKHQRQWVSTLKTYARPLIGTKPVDTVGTEDVLAILTPIWTTKTETAKRVQGRMENILRLRVRAQVA
jgi:hypothetical protein